MRGTLPAVFIWLLTLGSVLVTCGGQSDRDNNRVDSTRTLVSLAQEFRSHVERGNYDGARAMMAPGARRWWETREGEGQPWNVGPKSGPWSSWDDHFRSENKITMWKETPVTATAVIRETNDYFRLLERGWVTNEVTYYFDDSGKIEGLLIRAVGDRPPGRTEEFLAWARTHEPEDLAWLMPGGEIDPSGDHPERFRRLLERWRHDAGLTTDFTGEQEVDSP